MMGGLRIVVDDAVAWHAEAFGPLGQLRAVPGARIDRATLAHADALVVRSVTRVDAALLAGTPVRFVGSATAGEDHIDRAALERLGITVARAPGCNAQAVAEYVVSVLAHARHFRMGDAPGPIGIVGLGHVGRRTARALRTLGYQVLACDPPLAERRRRGEPIEDPDPALANLARFERLVSLDELLESAFVVSLHVPLCHEGPHPTAHLLDAERVRRLRPGQLLINTCRGGVVDDAALERWIHAGGRAILDVWEREPTPRPDLLGPRGVRLGTPHVAGYSLEGKVAATRQVHEALCRFAGQEPRFDGRNVLGPAGATLLRSDDPAAAHDWRPWIEAAVPLGPDDRALRDAMQRPPSERGRAFEALRRGYRLRRELASFRVDGTPLHPDTRATLAALGIAVPRSPVAGPRADGAR
ncbi:MAG: 4-phosphoerythronate dehydrogenase [Myxococcales bacterium]|nr:4-phosphoerythronate dehydrogenase [Myxococcales bacterium]